ENGSCPYHCDGFNGGDEGVGHRNDFITRSNFACAQRQRERIGAIGDTDAIETFAILGELALEHQLLWTKIKRHAVEHSFNGREYVGLDRLILRLEIN